MSAQNPKIMVVEDEEMLLNAIVKKLNIEAVETVSSISGKQALESLSTMEAIPDAIWLDYHLKDMDGLMFMNEMRKDSRFTKIPVFVISNSANQEVVDGILALGAEKYFLKAEHRLDELIHIIKAFIQEHGVKE